MRTKHCGRGFRVWRDRNRTKLRRQRRQGRRMERLIYLAHKTGAMGRLLARYASGGCGKCGGTLVKIWREYGSFYRPEDNRCKACADAEGRKVYPDPNWNLCPLILSPDGDVWGYTSCPEADIRLWEALPERRAS